ncbi:MAG: phytanoyl-CoA dioxygenase family protein [Lautropia sp.]|nr:phytanoyl-CoA dioxygenase family protein [Lautropia sp.]
MLTGSCLTKAREQYLEQGYAVIPAAWQGAEVKQGIDALETLVRAIQCEPRAWQANVLWQRDVPEKQLADIPLSRRKMAGEQIYIISDVASHDLLLRSMVLDARCGQIARALLGHDIVCHFSNATIRAAEVGCACSWHRDWPNQYCTTRTGRQLRIMICLDGMQDGQGATRVIPGSQHWDEERWHEWRQQPLASQEEGVPLVCSAGSAVVLGPSIVHGAGANLSPHPRRNLIAQWGAVQDMICAQRFEQVMGLSC